MQNIAAKYFF